MAHSALEFLSNYGRCARIGGTALTEVELAHIWVRWGALSRSLISTRVAVERERSFWEDLNFTNKSQLKLKAGSGGQRFTIKLVDHVAALEDEGTVLAATLILSYALAESAALDRLGVDARQAKGIEDWGSLLLEHAGQDWSKVTDGLGGAAEVGVIRNLIAHGQAAVDEKSIARLKRSGSKSFRLGEPIALDYERVGIYRARLRSLLTEGGLGT